MSRKPITWQQLARMVSLEKERADNRPSVGSNLCEIVLRAFHRITNDQPEINGLELMNEFHGLDPEARE